MTGSSPAPGKKPLEYRCNVSHLVATPIGRLFTVEVEVTKVDGRQIEFAIRETEGAKEIGVGSYSRVVIDVAKFARPLGRATLPDLSLPKHSPSLSLNGENRYR
jgi:predicted thioesterase